MTTPALRVDAGVPWQLSTLAIGGTSLLAAVSVAINFAHAYGQGTTMFNAWAFGLAMAGADALKCALPFLFAAAIDRRQWLPAGVIAPLFLLLTSFSMVSAIGFAAENRAGRIDGPEATNARYHIVKAAHDDRLARRAAIGPHRSRGEVESAISTVLLRIPEGASVTIARMSTNCSKPTPASRASCIEVGQLREELARAMLADTLAAEIARDQGELQRLIANGALRDRDAQASAIAHLIARFGADATLVRSSLSWLIAIVIEAGSSLGLYVAAAGRTQMLTPRRRPALRVTDWWIDRMQVAKAATLTFHEAFDDYQALAAARDLQPLSYGDFRQGFDVIAGHVSVVIIGSQIQDVRLGAG